MWKLESNEIYMLLGKTIVSWQDGKDKVIKRIYLPLQQIKIFVRDTQAIASPFKVKSNPQEVPNDRIIKHSLE